MWVPLSTRGPHSPNLLNSSVEAAVLGCRRYTFLKETGMMHESDKGTEEKRVALERAADFAIEKVEFELLQ
jgi:hypothetical protein